MAPIAIENGAELIVSEIDSLQLEDASLLKSASFIDGSWHNPEGVESFPITSKQSMTVHEFVAD